MNGQTNLYTTLVLSSLLMEDKLFFITKFDDVILFLIFIIVVAFDDVF